MAQTLGENNKPAKKSSRRVNGVIIALVFFVLDLILLGAFGKSGQAVTDFFVGIFGYAIYGYSFALTLLGVFYICNLKARQSKKLVLIYALIALTTITFAHIIGSHNYATSGWGQYISSSYLGADTAGGALASIFLYLFATKYIYILTLVANGIITVGLIAIAVLLQVNIDVNLVPRKVRKIRGVSHSNLKVYDVDGNSTNAPTLNNQTIKGKDLGDKLFRRGGKNGLNDYQPIDSVDISNGQPYDLYPDNYNNYNNMNSMGSIDFATGYEQVYPQEQEPQLILDTQEVQNEAVRNNYIYAGEDVAREGNATINSVQREFLGIDGNRAFTVIDEGENNSQISEYNQPEQPQMPPQRSQRERTQAIYDRFQSDSRNSMRDNDAGRIPSYYSQLHQNENVTRPRQEQSEQNIEQVNSVDNYAQDSEEFNNRLNQLLNSTGETPNSMNGDYSVERENENKLPQNKPTSQSQPTIEEVNEVNIAEDKTDESKVEQQVQPTDNGKKIVEDKSETRREESMDEYIARMNGEKRANEPSPVKNYNTTDDVKVEKPVENSDGYFKKTYDKPKPIVAKQQTPAAPKKEQSVVNGSNKQIQHAQEEKKEEKPEVVKTPYIPPSIDDLKDYIPPQDDTEDFMERTRIIERTYANFGIEVHIKNIVSGPAVTRYEFEIPETLSVDKIPSKLNNILMALAVETARIEAPIPGKSLCGIEVPNKVRKTVGLKEFIASDTFKNKKGGLYFALGKDVDNNCHYEDLTDFPHGLIAGGTGSGKSVCLNTMLCSLIYKYSPEELRLILVDPKMVEFSKYQALPHLLTPKIYNTSKESLGILKWLCAEMERRYALFAKRFVTKISSYNETPEVIEEGATIPYIVTIIDEVGDIMTSPEAKEFENYVLTLAQKARAAGIHLILATQRPSVNIITGTIKANLPTRIAFAVTSATDSRVILDSMGAEDLLGKGDMLIKTTKSRYMMRLQNPFIDDREIQNIMMDIVSHNSAYFDEKIEAEIASISEPKKEEQPTKAFEKTKEFDFPDELCADVLKKILEFDNVSISRLQRAFSLGFSRGAKIHDWLRNSKYIEKQGPNFVCVLTAEQIDEIIENARLGDSDENDA